MFGDKDGLLAELATHGFEMYLAEKHEALSQSEDPVADLYRGWDLHVDFGLRHPAFYLLMYGTARPGRKPPAADEAHALLVSLLERAAADGRLRVPVEEATHVVHAATTGATLALIGEEASQRKPSTSTRLRNIVLGSITTDPPVVATGTDRASRALALDAALTLEDGAAPPCVRPRPRCYATGCAASPSRPPNGAQELPDRAGRPGRLRPHCAADDVVVRGRYVHVGL
ncbi:TetR-like C-terminal domain-containing protein [Streptomyces albulus]|nr:TetR-like C-terminal domain-containing protein [Streptomyces noursei]